MNDWHASLEDLTRFALAPATVSDTAAASIETHLMGCELCRAVVANAAPPHMLEDSWTELVDRIDRPRRSWLESLMSLAGTDSTWSRLVAATPGMQASGLISLVVIAGLAVLVARADGSDATYLALAPLLPLASVAVSFRSMDPIGETAVATPMYGAGLLLRRAVVVLSATIGVLLVASLALPGIRGESASWLLPALALSIGAIAMSTWTRLDVAVASLGISWITVVVASWWLAGRSFESADVFRTPAQLGSLVLALLFAAAAVVRKDRFTTLEAFK